MMLRELPREPDGRSWLLKALREAAHALEEQLWSADPSVLRTPPGDDEWSLLQIAAHMREREEYFVRSLELILHWDAARIQAFDGEKLAEERDDDAIDIYECLDAYTRLRHAAVEMLWMAADTDWDKTGIHQYLGPVSIAQIAREQNQHDLGHLWHSRRVLDALSTATPATP